MFKDKIPNKINNKIPNKINNKIKVVYTFLKPEKLKAHERFDEKRVQEIEKQIKERGYVDLPIIVDNKDHVILDGHHRFEALKRLGAVRIPVYMVDYYSEEISVERWPNAMDNVSKEEVIRRGLKGELYPPKTSRHIFKFPFEVIKTDLSILR